MFPSGFFLFPLRVTAGRSIIEDMKGISAYSLAPLLISIIAVLLSTFFLTAPWPDYNASVWDSIIQDALPIYVSAVAVFGIAAVAHIVLSPKKKYNLLILFIRLSCLSV